MAIALLDACQQVLGGFYGGVSGAAGDISSGDSQDQASGGGKGGVQGDRRLHNADCQVRGCAGGGCAADGLFYSFDSLEA